ncbi:MAG: RimK family alpha-L-glutamate ligase [Planctomycetota bacterium]
MRIAVLSANPQTYSTRRFVEAGEQKGVTVDVLDPLCFTIELESHEPLLYYENEPVQDYDAILPRIGASITYYGTAVVRQFEQLDVYTPNPASGILNTRDKLLAMQILSRHDIGMPHTAYVRRREDVLPAIERIGGAPVIIKLLEGTQGVGVILADTEKIAEAIVETLQVAKQNVLLQKFVAESRGKDIRAFIVGDRVVAAMRRRAQGQEFRSNIHRGGTAEPVELDEEWQECALKAARVLGLKVAGVDMLESNEGPQVMEVNSSPGLEGIEGTTRLDIAGAVIDFIRDQVDFPELDIRQRLTVSRGYVVAELVIPDGSPFVGQTIEGSGLQERDLVLLTLRRGRSVISNPKRSRVLEPEDRLLCYGKMEAMRDLIPDREKRRKERKIRKLRSEVANELQGLEGGA